MVSQLEAPHRPLHSNLPPSLPHSIEGIVQVFTSSHRSFFTNVMAQALRIAGQGTSVLVVQFLKGGIGQGHQHPMRLGQNLDWIRCDLPRCISSAEVEPDEVAAVRSLWDYTQQVAAQGNYAMLVLDELSLAINFGLLSEAEVLSFLNHRPAQMDVILTGPEMPAAILEIADQITELRRTHRP